MSHDIVCWKCGATLAHLSLPLSRRDECKQCRAELHACRLCLDYDEHVAKRCREPTAEEVSDKERANFCGHFAPSAKAYKPKDQGAANAALSELEKLFGK